MKRKLLCLLIVLTAVTGLFAETEFTINVIQENAMPKVVFSKNSNLMPATLLTKGSGTGLVSDDAKYLGIGKGMFATTQKIQPQSIPQTWELDMGKPILSNTGTIVSVLGALCVGVGAGILIPNLDSESNLKAALPIALSCAGSGTVLLGGGIALRTIFHPKFTQIN